MIGSAADWMPSGRWALGRAGLLLKSFAVVAPMVWVGSTVRAERQPAAQTPSFRVETRLVEVPVVVRDRKTGRTVEGLTASPA